MKLIFCLQIKVKCFLKLILRYYTIIIILLFVVRHAQISPKNKMTILHNVFTISQKEDRDEVDYLHVDNYQSFLQVDFNTFDIKVSYKVILSLRQGMIKHSQRT